MVHEPRLDTAVYSAVCPGSRLLVCSSSRTLLMKRHSKMPSGGLRFRSSRMTGQQPYFIFRESACSSPSAPNSRERRHTEPTLSAKLSRPVICPLEGRQHVSGRGVSLDAGAGLYDHTGQWRSLFERSALGAAVTNSALRFLMVNPAFLRMVGVLKRRTTAALAPRHLCGWRRRRTSTSVTRIARWRASSV